MVSKKLVSLVKMTANFGMRPTVVSISKSHVMKPFPIIKDICKCLALGFPQDRHVGCDGCSAVSALQTHRNIRVVLAHATRPEIERARGGS